MRYLLTGATGFIGSYLRSLLLQEGHDLVVITRNPASSSDVQSSNQQFVSWEEDLVRVIEETDVVINLAGENLFGKRWTEPVKRAILASRVESTRRLVEAMERAEKRPELMISASAVDYYGDRGADLLEESEPSGFGFLADVCREWEEASRRAVELGVRVANPRIGIALQQDGGALQKMKLPFLLFIGGPLGSGEQYMPWIHMDDLCRALLYPVTTTAIRGPYNACSPNPVTMKEFSSAMGRVLNRPSLFRVPGWLLKGVLGEAALPVLNSRRVLPSKLQKAGFQFEFEDLEEALADLL